MSADRTSGEAGLGGENGMISLYDVRFTYPGHSRTILHDLRLEIPRGAITAVLGPNGSGKTTLLHLILGIRSPQQGRIELSGRPQNSYTRRELSRLVGLVPQDEPITFDFTVLEYVLLGRAPYIGPLDMPGENDRRIALQALQSTGVADLQHRSIATLSGGERQLTIVTRALAQQPRILLLDEPTAHLDLSNKSRILQILGSLQAQGVTIVLTTHDPQVASSVADFVVLMRQGQVVDAGPPGTVLTSEKLSATYDTSVEVLRVGDKTIVLLS